MNGGYQGAQYDGNEGFDDHDVADFGQYLCAKYGATPNALEGLGITAADNLDCSGPDAGSTFDYRGYIARYGATSDPLGAANPLAADWGSTVPNRPDPSRGTFVETYPSLVYWQQIVVALRTFARERLNKEVLITANGIFPFVDFQSVGLYDWNQDGTGPRGFDWVPVVGGDFTCFQDAGADAGACALDGTISFTPAFAALKARSKRIVEAAGGTEVPLLLFLDWPTDSMSRYYALPLTQRQDYIRLYVAEAAALGMWFAVPLATTTDTDTATALGMMDFFKQLRAYYGSHKDSLSRSPGELGHGHRLGAEREHHPRHAARRSHRAPYHQPRVLGRSSPPVECHGDVPPTRRPEFGYPRLTGLRRRHARHGDLRGRHGERAHRYAGRVRCRCGREVGAAPRFLDQPVAPWG